MSSTCTSSQMERGPGLSDWTKTFDEILRRASRNVQEQWFQLQISGGDPVYRERVYCYELYHQMRCRWPKGTDCILCGEVDKRGHPYFGPGQRKPDFLVHAPGEDRNYVVIEVKSCKGARDAERIEEDIKTLVEFTRFTDETPHPYRRAIYLIFGEGAEEVLGKVTEKLNGSSQDAAKIEVWTHCRVREAASRQS